MFMKLLTVISFVLCLNTSIILVGQTTSAEKTKDSKNSTDLENKQLLDEYVSNNKITKIEELLKNYTFDKKQLYNLLSNYIAFANKNGTIVTHDTIIALIKNGLAPQTNDETVAILFEADKKPNVQATSGMYGTSSALALKNQGPLTPKIIPYLINEKNISDVLEKVIKSKKSAEIKAPIIVAIKKTTAAQDNKAVKALLENIDKELKAEIRSVEQEESNPQKGGCTIS